MTMHPLRAAETLEELAELRRRSRRSLGQPWFPMVCFGIVTIFSAPLVAVAGTVVLLPLWIAAGVGGMVLTSRYYHRRGRFTGITARSGPVWAVAIGMFVVCLLAGIVGGNVWGAAGGSVAPIVIVILGYTAMGWLQRNALPPAMTAAGGTIAALLALSGQRPWLVESAFGVTLVGAGAILRTLEKARIPEGCR